MTKEKSLQAVLDRVVDGKRCLGLFCQKDAVTWYGASGNLTIDHPYFIASTTKLFTTALILKLRHEGKLNLDDKVGKSIDPRFWLACTFTKEESIPRTNHQALACSHVGTSRLFSRQGCKQLEFGRRADGWRRPVLDF